MLRSAREDRALDQHSFGKDDGEGGRVRLSLWNHPGEGIYGMFARCRRIVEACEQILDDEVYHYHSKMIMKDAKVGGAWTWHQDYGYWYQNGVLFPDLVSVFIAVDPSTKENGCLQVIEGSHHLGRIDHVLTGQQAGADMERRGAGPEPPSPRPCRDEAGRCALLPSEPAAPVRPQHVGASAVEHDLLLQCPPQRPVQGGAPPAIHAPGPRWTIGGSARSGSSGSPTMPATSPGWIPRSTSVRGRWPIKSKVR